MRTHLYSFGRLPMGKNVYATIAPAMVLAAIASLVTGCIRTSEAETGAADRQTQVSTPSPEPSLANPAPHVKNGAYEYAIYTCNVGSEERPAVQIDEVRRTANDTVTGISVHVAEPDRIDTVVIGGRAVWDYKAVSSSAGPTSIRVVYDPQQNPGGYDWVLNIKGRNIDFTSRVKDCTEVSAE